MIRRLWPFAFVVAAARPAMAQQPTEPARGRPETKPVADSLALQPVQRMSWTSDRMRFGIGDIVTIMIDESTVASANLTDNNSEQRSKSMGLNITPPASPGAPSTAMDLSMAFDNNGDSRKSGEAVRKNAFRTLVAARVVAVSPTGMLQLKGKKTVNIDKNQQDVIISGWVRPQDINPGSNTVVSSRLADADVQYAQKGDLGKPRSGLLSRMLGAIWP
ncbi:MAG: flagellar basal body L-ring protein FlgH [Gemmatimonadetes bacterium]|nr:flagellar basal body L-ring protein FlgH [Gemmatimonadota bacterium]